MNESRCNQSTHRLFNSFGGMSASCIFLTFGTIYQIILTEENVDIDDRSCVVIVWHINNYKIEIGVKYLMYKITICDDQQEALQELKQIILQEYDNVEVYCVQNLTYYGYALENKQEEIPDILILDIKWKEDDMTGIDWAVKLQKCFPALKIIFLTGYIDYATDIFMARPSYFLTKPVQKEKLREAIDRVMQDLEKETENPLVLQVSGELQVINPSDVLFIESKKHELIIYDMDKENRVWMKLDEILNRLPDSFIRIHQSFAVNASYIKKFSPDGVVLFNDLNLPVSRSRYSKAKNRFLDYLENK